MGFWGPKMERVFDWAKTQDSYAEGMTPIQFFNWVDERLGVRHPEGAKLEDAAEFWLAAIQERGDNA